MFNIFNRNNTIKKNNGNIIEDEVIEKNEIEYEKEQNEEDNYLELKLRNVQKMNQDQTGLITNSLIITDDDLNGHSILFGSDKILYDMNGIFEIRIGDKTNDGKKTLVFIIEDDNLIDHFVLSPLELMRIREFYSLVNKNIEMRQNKFSEKINLIVQELKSNNEIYKICYNFIPKYSEKIFYDLEYVFTFEKIIMAGSRIGIKTLSTENHVLQNENILQEMKEFYQEQFIPLLKIISSRYSFSDKKQGVEEANYATWKLLREIAIDYFSDDFKNNFGHYFSDIEKSDLDELAFIYTEIDSLEANSLRNISALTYFLMKSGKFHSHDFFENQKIMIEQVLKTLEYKKLNNFENQLLQNPTKNNITINDVDLMSGHEFENFIGTLFSKMGYSTTVTKGSGDQGIDVIAEKNCQKIGIQAKCYTNSVTNKAIQEVVAGLSYYNLDKGIVVTNNYFTDSAIKLAESNGIILWDRNILKEKINEIIN